MYSVSLIIPVYNVAEYIQTSFYSALNQTFQSIEYIIIDDCGTDNSMNILYDILDAHPRRSDVRIYHHDENRGLSAARNTGLKKATGEYVYFMDSDDEIVADCIEMHYKSIQRSNADFTVANIRLIGARSVHIKPIPNDAEQLPPLQSFFERKWNISACNKLYKRSFLCENKLFFQEELLHEDILWSYEVAQKANKIALVFEHTYLYKVRKGSITTYKNGARKIDSLLFILQRMKLDWENRCICNNYAECYAHFFNFYRFNTALLLLNYSGNFDERRNYYNQISSLKNGVCDKGGGSLIFQLSFYFFYMLFNPLYFVYKRITCL